MVDLIYQITVLTKEGVDPSQYFKGKDNDKKLEARLRKKYGVVKYKREFVIDTINYQALRVVKNLLMIKIVWKNHPN